MTKRGLTYKTGPGDAFALESDKDVWYTCDSVFNKHFLGGDKSAKKSSNDPHVMTQKHGYVIVIQDPPDAATEEET